MCVGEVPFDELGKFGVGFEDEDGLSRSEEFDASGEFGECGGGLSFGAFGDGGDFAVQFGEEDDNL